MNWPLFLLLMAAAATPALAAETTLAPESRAGLALTVYGDGQALVWDTRTASLAAGDNSIGFEGVSPQMLPSSAMIEAADGVQLQEVSYAFALLTQKSLLRRFVGQEVLLVRTHPTTGEQTTEAATLLSVADGSAILRVRDHVISADPSSIAFREVPAGLQARPTLVARLQTDKARDAKLTLGYITKGLGWRADYVALWNEAAGNIDLTGRATLSNTSGADYPGAAVTLVAGTVNRVSEPEPRPVPMMRTMAAAPPSGAMKAMPERQAFADLHLYTVPRPVGLPDQQTVQVTLLQTGAIPVKRTYVSEGAVSPFRVGGEPQPTHPQVELRFDNKPKDGTGEPLPAGVARVYAADGKGLPRLLGEQQIEHTPAGAPVSLSPGEAFDITVTRRQTDFARGPLPEGVSETSWAIEVRNAKDQPATVRLVETIPGDWTILAESAAHEKETADRIVWTVTAPAKGTAQLTYKVRVQQ